MKRIRECIPRAAARGNPSDVSINKELVLLRLIVLYKQRRVEPDVLDLKDIVP